MSDIKALFEEINSKLNKIIALLEKPKAETKDEPPNEPPPN